MSKPNAPTTDDIMRAMGLDVPEGMSGLNSDTHADSPLIRAAELAGPVISMLGAVIQQECKLSSGAVANVLAAVTAQQIGEVLHLSKLSQETANEVFEALAECVRANAAMAYRIRVTGMRDLLNRDAAGSA